MPRSSIILRAIDAVLALEKQLAASVASEADCEESIRALETRLAAAPQGLPEHVVRRVADIMLKAPTPRYELRDVLVNAQDIRNYWSNKEGLARAVLEPRDYRYAFGCDGPDVSGESVTDDVPSVTEVKGRQAWFDTIAAVDHNLD